MNLPAPLLILLIPLTRRQHPRSRRRRSCTLLLLAAQCHADCTDVLTVMVTEQLGGATEVDTGVRSPARSLA